MTSVWEGADHGGGVPDDDDGHGLKVEAGLHVEIGKLTNELRRHRKTLTTAPRFLTLAGQGVCPTPTATFGFALGGATNEGPALGRIWLTRRIAVGGLAWGTAAAGTAEIYVSGLTTGEVVSTRPLTDLVDQSGSMPNKAFYSNEQVSLVYGQRLHVVIVGGTAGQQYVASMLVVDLGEAQSIGLEL